LAVNVYNFDPVNQWVVDDWASNNGETSGGPFTTAELGVLNSQSSQFVATFLPHQLSTDTVDTPDGPIPTVKWVASWATYVFGNKDTIGGGVFNAMQAELGKAGRRVASNGVAHDCEQSNATTDLREFAVPPGVKSGSYSLDIVIGLPGSAVPLAQPSAPSVPGFGQCGGQGWTGATSWYVSSIGSAWRSGSRFRKYLNLNRRFSSGFERHAIWPNAF
jgi:hypothetical protein